MAYVIMIVLDGMVSNMHQTINSNRTDLTVTNTNMLRQMYIELQRSVYYVR